MSAREPASDCAHRVDGAAYVLGALPDAEAERYREHMLNCAGCRAEVAELQLAADLLPTTATPALASEALRERVLATVRSEAELLRAAGREADEPPRAASRWRLRRITLPVAGAALTATAAVVAAIVIAIGGGSPSGERVTTAQVTSTLPGARASLRQFDGHAVLAVSGMQQPPLGKIYEVWLKRGAGSPQPTDALFSVTSRGSGSTSVPANLHGVRELMVTTEPLGGSSHPTSPPLIRVVLDA